MKRHFLILVIAVAVALALFVADRRLWLIDDRNQHDGVLLAEEFDAAREANRQQISVIAVNGGNWLALCLAGAGENAQDTLLRFGQKNRVRVPTLQRIRSWLYAGHVPRNEIALVIVTERYSIRSRRLPNMTGNPNFKSACALRNDAGLSWK